MARPIQSIHAKNSKPEDAGAHVSHDVGSSSKLMSHGEVKDIQKGGRLVHPNNGSYEVWETANKNIAFLHNDLSQVGNAQQADAAHYTNRKHVQVMDSIASDKYRNS